jgi:hypothetical protein
MRKIGLAALFALPVLILLPHLAQFPFQPGAEISDLLVTHYPNGLFIQRSLAEWKTIPLWSPAILSGYPFGANPLSGLYYLPGWLALLFPLPLGFNLAILLHLVWGGVGMYVFLRAEGRSQGAALLGALTFEALPKLFSHLGAGHITLIYAVAWTPWLLYAECRVTARPIRILPGVILGVIVLADVRWAAYSGLLWLAYSLYRGVQPVWLPAVLAGNGIRQRQTFFNWKLAMPWMLARLANTLVAVLIAAPLILPLVQYTQLSTRSQLTPQESFTLSLPPGQLFGLVYPNIGGAAEWVLYPGAVALALALYVLGRPAARRKNAFWLVILLATLIFALGSYIPPLEWLARLPGMDLLRVPPRVLFLTGFCFAVVAANGLDDLYGVLACRGPGLRDRSGLVVFAATAFAVLFAIAVWVVNNTPSTRIQFAWGAIFLLAGATLILLARARKMSRGVLTVLALSVSLIDLIGVNGLSLDFRPVSSVFSDEGKVFNYLNEQDPGALFRVYSPSYSLPQHLAAWYRVELADGVDPLQLAAYRRYMEPATGVPFKGYSVTLPPFANANLAEANASYTPDAEKLGLLNVKYVVSTFSIKENGLVLLARFGQTRVYQNMLALPRAWVQSPEAPLGGNLQSEPWLVERPNWIVLKAKGPGLLVLSELAYPGWQATIDGKPSPVEIVGGLLRGVNLPAGEHEVVFLFRPLLVYAGLAMAALTWAALIFFWRYKGRHSEWTNGGNRSHG